MLSTGAAVAIVTLVGAAFVLGCSVWMVGRVAEGFGADPARWRIMMLPFGVFGPVVANVLLSRGNGGGPGRPGGFA